MGQVQEKGVAEVILERHLEIFQVGTNTLELYLKKKKHVGRCRIKAGMSRGSMAIWGGVIEARIGRWEVKGGLKYHSS